MISFGIKSLQRVISNHNLCKMCMRGLKTPLKGRKRSEVHEKADDRKSEKSELCLYFTSLLLENEGFFLLFSFLNITVALSLLFVSEESTKLKKYIYPIFCDSLLRY